MYLLDSTEPKLSQKKLESFYSSQEKVHDSDSENAKKQGLFMTKAAPTKKIQKKEKKDNTPKVKKTKEVCLTEEERDCLDLVKTYFKSGQYAHDLFFKVSSNVWKHYEIDSVSKQNYIIQTAKKEVNFQNEDQENA